MMTFKIKKVDSYFLKVSIVLALLFAIFIISSSGLSASSVVIDNSTSGGIKDAISNVNSGDTIILESGVYKGDNNTKININKSITLQGNGSDVIIDAQKNGRIFNILSNNITFINITFINGNVNGDGGAIHNDNFENITFINCKFINNTATAYGGAIDNNGHNFAVINCSFTNNNVTGGSHSGGAIRNQGNNFKVINCTFTNNEANGGGAFFTMGNNSTIINSTFINNTARGYGGAIMYMSYNFTITNSIFTNNTATWGGVIFGQVSDGLTIINSSFNNNNATIGSGGVIYSDNNNYIIINSNFTNNTANGFGGAIHNHGSNFTLIDCTFTNNTAYSSGGAIYNSDRGLNFKVINSTFNYNTASYGGAIYNYGNMLVSGNLMSGNSANILGNVIYNNGGMGVLNLTYINNSTYFVKKGENFTLFATLIDDMGNLITGQNISFYVNGTLIGSIEAIEGFANITYFINAGEGIIPVNGNYMGNGIYDININNGALLFVNETTVNGDIGLDKKEYMVNETGKVNINVKNKGSHVAKNVKVKVNLDPNFLLNNTSIIVSHGYYDAIAGIWYIDDLNPDEEAIMTFNGKFTEKGNYIFSILIYGDNFNDSTSITNVLVKESSTPKPTPKPTPEPENNTNNINTNNTIKNPVTSATMKETGIPVIAILLVFLASLGLLYRKQ